MGTNTVLTYKTFDVRFESFWCFQVLKQNPILFWNLLSYNYEK